MSLVRRVTGIGLGLSGLLVGMSFAQTASVPPLADTRAADARVAEARPLSGAEASECRAIAEVLRDRQYDIMDSLIVRIERSPNLSTEGLEAAKKSLSETDAAIKAAEGHTERFVFAAVATPAIKSAIGKMDSETLTPRLLDCLKRMPVAGPQKPSTPPR
ncbi:hypothetical protein ATDW_18580 [Asticcacaulis sp. DW145]|uniref:Secreted protein n=1 Tax=Asticcacaulis currens TaxID=2984210 RepID=A0ABT5ILA2_9CAUL|nr:hypothetical protein [Asticcacaulis currens]MDC7696056.1 hypothetical protein [Asticcacaulis currens]BEV11362.1 hypothetical protein ATDW_18580 [Asticcacaulis sp. DW145]